MTINPRVCIAKLKQISHVGIVSGRRSGIGKHMGSQGEGIYARGLPHSRLSVGRNGALGHGGCRAGPLSEKRSQARPGGEIGVESSSSSFALPICFLSFRPAPIFDFRPQFFEA
jgi:hypothetical protein